MGEVGPPWRCQAYLWTDLRGDPWSSQGVPRERHQGRRHLHRARQEEDRHRHGCRLCPEEAGTHPVRIRWLNPLLAVSYSPSSKSSLIQTHHHKPKTMALFRAKGSFLGINI